MIIVGYPNNLSSQMFSKLGVIIDPVNFIANARPPR